ncbi:MAG: ABC transporter ATP-binding protein [Chloroflexi bacterium]|nr:ABC transporter ATP-binding protein [Chloroflexota bacterium]
MADNTLAIETRGLRKEYGSKVAVAGLDLIVERGEVFGFLGPNGAGKTTSIKMLLGLASPTEGQAWLLGQPITDPACRRRVGFLPEHFRFHEWMTAGEFLDLHGRLHHVPADVRRKRIPELLKQMGLAQAGAQRLATFSKGMLQRIGLAQALINEPELVFLDEPTSGLDPLGRRMVRNVIAELRQRGTTVFLNSHLLSEVEVTCTRVAFITEGRVRHVASLDRYEANLLQVELRVGQVDERLIEGLRRWSDGIEWGNDGHTLTLNLAGQGALPDLARWVVQQGYDLYSLSSRPRSLEDLFVDIVGEAIETGQSVQKGSAG